jgi:hypothetical protein
MKTIALTLIAAALGFAQSQSGNQSGTPAPAPKSTAAKRTTQPSAQPPAQPAAHPVTNTKAKTPVPPKPKTASKAEAPVTTAPQGATQVEPNLYRYTDSSGKTWLYRQTPFGLSKWEDTPAAAPQQPVAQNEQVAVVDLGDSVRFEKKTPFGATQWVRKKTDLTDDEKALVAGGVGDKSKPPEKQ